MTAAPIRLHPRLATWPPSAGQAEIERADAILGLAIGAVLPYGLAGRHEADLIRLGRERLRDVVARIDAAVAAAVALEEAEALVTEHVTAGGCWCTWRALAVAGGCPGLRRARRAVACAERAYRKALRRLGGGR